MRTHALWLSASALALIWSGAAHAQAARGATPAGQGANQVEEVVVTGERRATNLQTTAIAATVLNQDDLIRNGVHTIDQLQFVSPSLTVNNFGQGNNVDIRGIGKGEHNTQTGTGVVTYRDGLASFPGYFQEEPYYDVASVEVLRGPQGTFSGQNSTGGAIIVNTANPVINGGNTGYLFAHYGNYNDVGLQGAVNLPVSDTLAARVAFNTNYRDTFYDLTGVTGNPNLRWGSARLSVLWTPTPSFQLLWKTDYNYLNNGGYFGDALVNPLTGLPNNTDHLFDIDNNFKTYAVDQFYRTGLKAEYTNPAGIKFRSVTGYQRGQTAWAGDIDGTALPAPNYIIDERVNETLWSQEFNIISPDNKPVTWVLGAYYNNNKYDFPDFNIGVPPGGFDERLEGVNKTHSYALFGQVSLNLPSGLQVQAGARYSKWSTTNHVRYWVPEFVAFIDQQQDETFDGDNFTGKLALNWKVNDDNFLYAFVATGAKPGGLNTSAYSYPPQPIPAPFKQEYVVDYELGWKARALDGHLRTQIGAFYNTFRDFQVIVPLPNNPLLSTEQNNPNSTKLYGVEASAQAVMGDFSVNANIALQHSSLGDFYTQDPRMGVSVVPCDPETGPASAKCINLGGNAQTYAPNFTFNVQAQYDIHLASGDVITPAVTYSHISEQWATLFENRSKNDLLDARDILGASLSWTHGDLTASLYGYNLTDQHYVSANLSPIRIAGAPRQFGISILKSF
jgi:iron complex outermembrane receptor protein